MNTAKDHIKRITRVRQFIGQNLHSELSLELLAEKASFSPHHFQRVFKSVVGETPKQYIKRLRLEGAAHLIVLKPDISMLSVALQFGYNSLEAFSRGFKDYYGVSPNDFRLRNEKAKMNILAKAKVSGETNLNPDLFLASSVEDAGGPPEIEVVKLPPERIIYLEQTLKNPETVAQGMKRIRRWAEARELIQGDPGYFWLMHDYPAFTALEKCRFYPAVSVREKPNLSEDILYLEMPGRTCAMFSSKGGIHEMIRSITRFASLWLPESGYAIEMSPARMIPLDDPEVHHLHDIHYEICIALRPR